MAKYSADTIPCCTTCDTRNETKSCRKCAVVYCKHFASSTDIRYCANCMGDFTLKETIMEKTVEHERADGSITLSRKSYARHITLQGTDWLFNAHKIEEMDDAEIEATIEYHRANVSLMLQEREARKVERFRKLSTIKIVHTPRKSQYDLEKESSKKSRTKVKDKGPEALIAALTLLGKSGMSKEHIIELLSKGKK
jgi:hypothetical protein